MNCFSDETYYESDEELQRDLNYINFKRLSCKSKQEQKENIKLYNNNKDIKKSENKIIITSILIILFSIICMMCNFIFIKIAILLLSIYLFVNLFKRKIKIE